jgi:hypothetical protein
MKKYNFIIFSLFTSSLFAQDNNDKKIFLDSLNQETTEESYKYYRIIKDYALEKDKYEIVDYYLNNHIKHQGFSHSKSGRLKIGQHKEFYESGNLKSVTNYNNENNNPTGNYFSLYENGKKEIDGEYTQITKDNLNKESVIKIISYWDENENQKIVEGNGFMIERGEFENSRGEIKGGFKDGIWKGIDLRYKIQFVEKYELGKFMGGVSRDALNIEFGYLEINKPPEFIGGMHAFGMYIAHNYKTPSIQKSIKGKIFLGFTIGVGGEIEDIKIIQSLETDLDTEAIRLIKTTSNLWTPGEYRGIKQKIKFSLPINLNFQNDD